jgi:hypothetical protein
MYVCPQDTSLDPEEYSRLEFLALLNVLTHGVLRDRLLFVVSVSLNSVYSL